MQLFSAGLRENACKRMIPLLHREGRAEEATAVEAALFALPPLDPPKALRRREGQEVSATRSAHIVDLAGSLLFVFGAATAIWLLSIIALRWKPGLSRGLNRVASVLSFMPPLLFFSSAILLVAYYPYARHIGQIASQEELIRGHMPFLKNLYDFSFLNFGFITDVWLVRMFWPTVWRAASALTILA